MLKGMTSAKTQKNILVCVAWPYANGPRHIGHVAGFGVPSDVFARYQRMAGNNVLMVSGTDEHGTPLLVQADKEGVSVKELADRYNEQIVHDLAGLGLSYDLFTRTSTRNHYAVVQQLFKGLYANGYMIKETTQGAISPSNGRTLPDRYIEGTCPICGATDARGDQCDTCGNQLDPADLINPVSKINGETPKFVETEHFMLDLPALHDALKTWLSTREKWRPNVLKFSLNLLEDMRPRAMTRDIDWGIPIPVEDWQDNPSKKLYVWFDAVVGYLSASIEWAERSGNPDAWKTFWQDPETASYYFMGKDNITFHSQIWPAELLGYAGKGSHGGQEHELGTLNLPTEVVSSEFLTMSGSKFSSSKGVVIYVKDFLKEFGADPLRYFIAVAGPENNDTDFTWDEFVRRVNNELANGWATWSTALCRWRTRTSARFQNQESSPKWTRKSLNWRNPRLFPQARTWPRLTLRARSPRSCTWSGRPTRTSRTRSRGSSRRIRNSALVWRRSCGPHCRWSATAMRC